MASAAAYDAFHARLTAAWISPNPGLVFENEFAQQYLDAGLSFVYVEIYGDSLNQETLGAPGYNQWKEEGATYLHVMTAAGGGSRQARVWANDLLNLFREQSIVADPLAGEALFMTEMSIGAGSPGQDFPNYYAMTATIQWRRREYTNLP